MLTMSFSTQGGLSNRTCAARPYAAPMAVRSGRAIYVLQSEFLRNLRRADRCADLNEQPMRLAKLALAGRFVTCEPSQLGVLDVEEGLVALRARHFEPGSGFGERVLDFSHRIDAPDFAKSADSGEHSRELPESGTPSAADRDCFPCES